MQFVQYGGGVGSVLIDALYKTENIDDYSQTTYTYIGKSAASNAWYIVRITNADNTFRYAKGTTDYTTNRTNKALLSYNLWS